jgi:hypothetical protein
MDKISPPVVHIAFNSDEVDRVIKPIIETKTDKAYIFTFYKEWINHDTNKEDYQLDQNLNRYKEIADILHKEGIELVRDVPERLNNIKDGSGNKIDGIPVSYHDYVEIMQKVSKIIFDERFKNKNVDIKINIAVGSKITAIAGIDCARFWDIDAIYVIPEFWDQKKSPNEPLSSGKMFCVLPPKFEMKQPPDELIQALITINDRFEQTQLKIQDDLREIEKLLEIKIIEDLVDKQNFSGIQEAYIKISKAKKKGISKNTKIRIDQLLQEIVVLIQEKNYGILKPDLLELLRRKNLVKSRKYDHIPIDQKLSAKQKSAYYGVMNKQIIEPMTNWNLIIESNDKRNKKIQITDEGLLYLKIFKNKVLYNIKFF